MVFGDPRQDHLQLNDDSLWPADLGWDEPEGTPEDLNRIRQLLFEGRNVEADSLFVLKFSRKQVIRSHQTLGDLWIDLGHENVTDYRMELDISKAIVNISYKTDGYQVRKKIFVSHPHQAVVMQIETELPNGLNGQLRLSRPEDEGTPTVHVSVVDGLLKMTGEVTQRGAKFDSEDAPITEGVEFETLLKIKNEGGSIRVDQDQLEMVEVNKATIYLVSNSSYYHQDYSSKNLEHLTNLEKSTNEELEKTHIEDYYQLFSRIKLDLGKGPDSLATDARIKRMKDGELDPGLESLLFQYGRYLLISSSRPGTNPANLQGLWNPYITAPWNADYHLNINLQMNYWLADPANLSELNSPLFEYIDQLVQNGKRTANVNFGCNGAFIPHATDLWAPTWLRAPTAYWGCSVGAGGWLMQHYWDHFEYSRDTSFLETRVLPALQEVAGFYSDWLIEDPRDGYLISAPSTSPENRFINDKGEAVATCLGSAMDQQVIYEVFSNYLDACQMLGKKSELSTRIEDQLKKLRPGFVIGSDGRILEWDREYKEFEPGHRHMSHLYGFHPGSDISPESNPEIFKAVKTTLDYRLENGGAGTGWSRAWLINCAARLLDAEMAHEHIQLLFQKSILSNLFDSHPPFQIDGNFGYTTGVAEMLVQSYEKDIIRILPALPRAWKNGYVEGLKARGGLELDIYWSDHKLTKLIIDSSYDSSFELLYQGKRIPVTTSKGVPFVLEP